MDQTEHKGGTLIQLRGETETEAIVHPTNCRRLMQAGNAGLPAPACTWRRDGDGYACTICGDWTGPDMARGSMIAADFGDLDPSVISAPMAAAEDRIREIAADLVAAGEDPTEAAVRAGAILILCRP